MKNILVVVAFFALFFHKTTHAQNRFVDLEAECLYPKGTYENGDRGILRFNGINRGPDEIKAGDSLWYVLYDNVDGVMKTIYYQGPLRMPYAVPVGEKFYYRDNYSILLYFPDVTTPKEVQFCMRLVNYHLKPNGDKVYYSHRDTLSSNDTCCQPLTILPLPNSIAASKSKDEFAYIYPNPSKGKFELVVDWLFANEDKMKMTIYDLSGRAVYEQHLFRHGANSAIITVDVSHILTSGIYALHVQGGNKSSTKKMMIQ